MKLTAAKMAFCILGGIALLGALALSGCGTSGSSQKEALIGANLELSGKSGEWGEDSRRGIELALEEINAKPEQKIKLKCIFEDNKSEPGASKNAMKSMKAIKITAQALCK